MSDDNLTLLQQAQRHAAQVALDTVERDKGNQASVEVTSAGEVEASLSGTVRTSEPALRWLNGTVVTGYLKQKWQGARDRVWGARAVKKF